MRAISSPESAAAARRAGFGSPRATIRQFGAAGRFHWPLVALLAVGAAVRLAIMIAYRPALFFSDSWGYVFTAFTGHPVAFSYLRPDGYPVLLKLLTFPGRDLAQLVGLQHICGLLTGGLVYAAVVRAGCARLLGAVAAATVLLDGYMITLEQYLMPEAFFTITLLIAVLLIAWARLPTASRKSQSNVWVAAAAGFLLAAATLQREVALSTVPICAIYLIWIRAGWRRVSAFGLALAAPLLAYAALYDARFGVFGFSETSGWTLYGRVAAFADCAGAGIRVEQQPLCETPAERHAHPDSPTWYIWASSSPAGRAFPDGHDTRQAQEHADAILGAFARRIIAHQPLDYIRAVATDALNYFTPGATPFNDAVSATALPATSASEPRSERVRRRVLPRVHPQVRAPADVIRAYRRIVHIPRPLLAAFAFVSLLVLASSLPRRPEVFLFTGGALALIIATAATAGFGLRYLLPAVPLLAIGGSSATWSLLTHRAIGGPCCDTRAHANRRVGFRV